MRLSTNIAWKHGGSLLTSTSLWLKGFIRVIRLVVWKSATGMIQRLRSPRATLSPSRHYSYRSGIASRSVSTTQDEGLKADFPALDKAAALVIVKHLVKTGQRKASENLLVLPAHALEDWYEREAVRYLQEQKAARQSQHLPKGEQDGNQARSHAG